MRLINAKTLKLEEFIDGRSAPDYAILSHTWCRDEVLFNDMAQVDGVARRKKGWKKIELTCAQAVKDGLRYAWVDTCCIDKTSSAELSEAINSMFAWYRDSEVCYVYLNDVLTDPLLHGDLTWLFASPEHVSGADVSHTLTSHPGSAAKSTTIAESSTYPAVSHRSVHSCFSQRSESTESSISNELWTAPDYGPAVLAHSTAESIDSNPSLLEIAAQLKRSRWFSRGWTLQELLAPKELQFFGKDWSPLGSADDLFEVIASVTKIKASVLRKQDLVKDCSIACRMSWAASRTTTRVEDEAYCLLGIFGINMPLLYGEGRSAFIRLQKEIIQVFFDESILAWDRRLMKDAEFQALAQGTACFARSESISPVVGSMAQSMLEVTHKGVEMSAGVVRHGVREYVLLNCIDEQQPRRSLALEIRPMITAGYGVYAITGEPVLFPPDADLRKMAKHRRLKFWDPWTQQPELPFWKVLRIRCVVSDVSRYSVQMLERYPQHVWEHVDLCRADGSPFAFRIQVQDRDKPDPVKSTQITVGIGDGAAGCLEVVVLQHIPLHEQPIDAFCEQLNRDDSMMRRVNWLNTDITNAPCFSAGPYNIAAICDRFPYDDSYPKLLFLVYPRVEIVEVLLSAPKAILRTISSIKAWRRGAKRTRRLLTKPDSSVQGLEKVTDEKDYDVSNFISPTLDQYGTRWQRYRIRSAKPGAQPPPAPSTSSVSGRSSPIHPMGSDNVTSSRSDQRQRTIETELDYILQVKAELADSPEMSIAFLEIMKDYHAGALELEVIKRVSLLLRDKPTLIEKFNILLLKEGYRIECKGPEGAEGELVVVTTPLGRSTQMRPGYFDVSMAS